MKELNLVIMFTWCTPNGKVIYPYVSIAKNYNQFERVIQAYASRKLLAIEV